MGEHGAPLGEMLDDVGTGPHLAPRGEVAQAGGDIHGVADVVIALEQDHVVGREPAADRDGLRVSSRRHPHLQSGGHERRGVDAHEHRPVTQPFGDPDPTARADVPNHPAERGEDRDGALVALDLG